MIVAGRHFNPTTAVSVSLQARPHAWRETTASRYVGGIDNPAERRRSAAAPVAGLGWRNLADVHNLAALTASVSSVALAVVTAVATALGTSAAQVVVDRVLTPAPSVATQDPRSGE